MVLSVVPFPSKSCGQKVESFPDNPPKARVDAGLAFRQRRDPDGRITLPRLTRFPDKNVIAKVNDDLMKEERRLRRESWDCRSGNLDKAFWEQETHVAVLTRHVLSIKSEAFICCPCAHPDEEYTLITYDLTSGTRFDFSENAALIFTANMLPSQELIDLYRRNYPAHYGDCRPSLIEDGTELFLHFEPKGLAIIPHLPHVIAACGPEIVLPYEDLRGLLKEGNPFQSLIGP